jgi:hypothetical protein
LGKQSDKQIVVQFGCGDAGIDFSHNRFGGFTINLTKVGKKGLHPRYPKNFPKNLANEKNSYLCSPF